MATKAKKSQETPPLEDITDTLQNTLQTSGDSLNVKTDDMQSGGGLDISGGDNSVISPDAIDQALAGAEETCIFNVRVLNVPGGVRHRAGLTFTEAGADIDFSALTDEQIEKIKSDRFLRIKRV